jgi:hypothetical protein
VAKWRTCPTEADEPITVWGDIYLIDLIVALANFALFVAVLYRPFVGLAVSGVALYGSTQVRKGKPPGYLRHLLHYLEVGYRIPGFHPPRAKEYSVW